MISNLNPSKKSIFTFDLIILVFKIQEYTKTVLFIHLSFNY